jgi:hypothetical protein
VIDEVNRRFISTSIILNDATTLAAKGNALARTITKNWNYPVDIMFLTPDGELMSKLNSFEDFGEPHPDVFIAPKVRPPGAVKRSHAEIFLEHIARYPSNARSSS